MNCGDQELVLWDWNNSWDKPDGPLYFEVAENPGLGESCFVGSIADGCLIPATVVGVVQRPGKYGPEWFWQLQPNSDGLLWPQEPELQYWALQTCNMPGHDYTLNDVCSCGREESECPVRGLRRWRDRIRHPQVAVASVAGEAQTQ